MDQLHKWSDERGAELLDPKKHCKIEDLPESVKPGAELFAKKVVKAARRPSQDSNQGGGISPKQFFKVSDRYPNGRIKPSKIFMVKPYYEDFRSWSGVYYPIAGFAEMATQGIMHAAGLGDSTLKVHTFADPQNGSKPLLSVEFENGFRRVGELGMAADASKVKVPEKVKDTLARIGIIDYISNNQDRHGANLMAKTKKTGMDKAEVTHLLAIDHGRSFQYRHGSRFADNHKSIEHFTFHIASPGIRETLTASDNALPRREMKLFFTPKRFTGLMKWWKDKRQDIQAAFDHHIETVTNPDVKKWISNNFKERMETMDRLEKHWAATRKGVNDLKALEMEHIAGTVGKHAKKFANSVRYNEHGEIFADNGSGSSDDDASKEGRTWCAECRAWHTL